MNIDKKLRKLGFALVSAAATGRAIESLSGDVVERYAILEHEDWMRGKERFGWTYSPIRNDSLKQHDCLVPWRELPDEQRQKDVDAADNLIKLANLAGMKIVRLPSDA